MASPLEKLAFGLSLCNQHAGIESAQRNCGNPVRAAPMHCATGSLPLSFTSYQRFPDKHLASTKYGLKAGRQPPIRSSTLRKMSKLAVSLWPQGSLPSLRAERATTPTRWRNAGFTLIEWLIALTLLATLAGIAIPAYTNYVNRANIAQAKTDIRTLELLIGGYEAKNDELPDTLADIGHANFSDPWDNPYRYLRIAGAGLKGKGNLRKDRFLVPLNSDYDLYSMGKDGQSKVPLTAKVSRDDIIRANNGAFIGVAVDY